MNVSEKNPPNQAGQRLLEILDNRERIVDTGNKILDLLIESKMAECRARQIILNWNITLPRGLQMNDVHLVSLFSNLIDNALEAAEQASGSRKINIVTSSLANYWKITVVNSKNAKESPLKNEFKSRKAQKELHGLGLRIIRAIADQYEGDVCYDDYGEQFVVKVLLRAF